jgi:hypothetical protein
MATIIQQHLLHSFRRVLKPFVKLLVRAGVTYGEFSGVVKSVYVDCAAREGFSVGAHPTRARISMLTGVPRRDVDRYVDADGGLLNGAPSLGGIMVEVLQRWHTDPRYIGPYGIPLELEFEVSGDGRSFSNLVSLVDAEVKPRMILDELLRVGSVTFSGERYIRATSRSFLTPFGVSSEQLEYFVNTISLLAATLEFNMDNRNDTKRLERFVIADRGLTEEGLTKFEAYVRHQAGNFLLDLDNWLSPHAPADGEETQPRVQTGVHVFMFIDQKAAEPPLRELVDRPPDDIRR